MNLRLSLLILLAGPSARAQDAEAPDPEPSPLQASLHGDLKSFYVAMVSSPWLDLSPSADPLLEAMGLSHEDALGLFGLDSPPAAQGVASARLKLEASMGERLHFDAHWAFATQNTIATSAVAGMGSGVGLGAPEAFPLSWEPDAGSAMSVRHRVDRLVLAASLPHVDVALGRQPISFGTGNFFTPLDLVNPFHPATIDTEYKPGVDALRVDAYSGVSSQLTLAAAWAGSAPLVGPERFREGDGRGDTLEQLVLALSGQGTVGVTDVLGFAGSVHGEPVLGLGTISAIGPVGVNAEATLTLPGGDQDPFVRAVAGATWRPTSTTSVMGEAYVQTLGAKEPSGYLDLASDPRFGRGELWQMGQVYAALAVGQELTPLLSSNVAVIANLADPSALVVAGGAWSVADNADVAFGAYLGAGERPDPLLLDLSLDPTTGAPTISPPDTAALAATVNSEFGLYPRVFYVQMRTYF